MVLIKIPFPALRILAAHGYQLFYLSGNQLPAGKRTGAVRSGNEQVFQIGQVAYGYNHNRVIRLPGESLPVQRYDFQTGNTLLATVYGKLLTDDVGIFRFVRNAFAGNHANGNPGSAEVGIERVQTPFGRWINGGDHHGKNIGLAFIGKRMKDGNCSGIIDIGRNVGIENDGNRPADSPFSGKHQNTGHH